MLLDEVGLVHVERLMALMREYEIDELDTGTISLKKSRHRTPLPAVAVPDDNVTLAQHLAPLPNEPWNAVSQETVDAWAENGRP